MEKIIIVDIKVEENCWDFTKRKYPEQAAKGYCFRTNIDRDAKKNERRSKKKWSKEFLKRVYFDDKVFTIAFGVIREDLSAYYKSGIGEISHLCPVFGKMNEVPAK